MMKDFTEKEYDDLDELLTQTTPKVKANGTGFISRREVRLMGLSNLSVDYLLTKSEATEKTPAQIIEILSVRKSLLLPERKFCFCTPVFPPAIKKPHPSNSRR